MSEEEEKKNINPYTLQEQLPPRLFSNKFIIISLITLLFSGAILCFTGQLTPNNEEDYKYRIKSAKEDSLKKLEEKR